MSQLWNQRFHVPSIQEFNLQNQNLGIENTNLRTIKHILIGIIVNLNQVKYNAHFKRISDKFIIAVGEKDRKTALLSTAIKITKDGAPFYPNSTGNRIYGDVGYPRGFKMIKDFERITFLLNQTKAK